MAALPYLKFYAADYLADTAHLTTLEHGAYLLLIFTYWQRGESFRANDERTLNKRLATVARLSNEEWASVRETLSEFFNVCSTEWRHERIERDLVEVKDKANKCKNAGQARGMGRKGPKIGAQRTLSERSANAQRTLSGRSTIQIQIQIQIKPPLPPLGARRLLMSLSRKPASPTSIRWRWICRMGCRSTGGAPGLPIADTDG